MRSVDSATAAAIQSRAGHIPRIFVWIKAKNRDTGELEEGGFWSGDDYVGVSVVQAETGLTVDRTYGPASSLLVVDPIPAISDLTVRTVQVQLRSIGEDVRQLILGYDVRFAPIEIHRGLLSLDTHLLVAPPVPIFDGQVNGAPINTPAAGGEGGIKLAVVSHSRVLTRANAAKKSDESQQLRSSDRFRRYTDVAPQWDYFWGEAKAPKTASS